MEVSLVLTRDCNLACGYCFAGEKRRDRMPLERGRQALDFAFARRALDGGRLDLSFFGGEPLLEWDGLVVLAEEARARAEREGTPLALQVTTNGVLLDAERIARLGELGVHVALSLDGTETAHERARPTRGGRGSYAAASAALDRLLAAGRPFDVVTVIDPATVDALSEGVRALLDRGVERLFLNPNWAGAWTEERLAVWRGHYEVVAALVVAWFRRGRSVVVQPFDSAMVALASGREARAHRCEAGVRSFGVGPSGKLYGCGRGVAEDDGSRAIGDLTAGLDASRVARFGSPACPEACSCASLEETGDAGRPGPVQRWHDALVSEIAGNLVRALAKEPVGHATYRDAFQPVEGGEHPAREGANER